MHIGRTIAVVATITIAATLGAHGPAAAAPPDSIDISLLSTTDVHGHIYNWDYFADAPYSKPADILGLTRVSTVVNELRAAKGDDAVFVFDDGDAIQGTPLTYYYGKGDGAGDVLAGTTTHPMANAFNTMGYDAQVVGNHEFNYGVDMLDAYNEQLDAPLLGANVIDVDTGQPHFEPYTLLNRTIDGQPITVGVIGLVTPGVRFWDQQNVDGRLEFRDLVTTAQQWVPIVRAQADVVVVLAHTGVGATASSAYDPAPLPENAVNNIAELVPGIDVIVSGHTHLDRPSKVYTNSAGGQVLVTQPYYWARSVSEVSLHLIPNPDSPGRWMVDWDAQAPTVTPHYGKDVAEDPVIADILRPQHVQAVDYVNTTVGVSTTRMTSDTARYDDVAIIDFINNAQAEAVTQGLRGTAYEGLPVISQTSPFSRTAVIPQGDVTIRDIAGLYLYENTLRAVTISGAQLKDYLEFSAQYYRQVPEGAIFDPATDTNAVYPALGVAIPDYLYDVVSGVDYAVDISQPVGSRIEGLRHADGTLVADDEMFVMALSNFRQSKGPYTYPHVTDAPVIYDRQEEIRQLLIDWVSDRGVIDPAEFADVNWELRTTPWQAPAAPTTPTATTPATSAPTTAASGTPAPSPSRTATSALPATGLGSASLLALSILLVIVGGIVVILRRRATH